MQKKIRQYINELCDLNNMHENIKAKKMLINDFTQLYEECLRIYIKDYDEQKEEFLIKNKEEDEEIVFPLPENEQAFEKAKELFGIKAIIDKTYLIANNYGYYKKMKKAYSYFIKFLIALIIITSFYGIAFADTADSKISTLLLWVVLIVLIVGFVIVAESTSFKINKIFNELKGRMEYFYVKTDNRTLLNMIVKKRDEKQKKRGDK